jgi:amylosucrase
MCATQISNPQKDFDARLSVRLAEITKLHRSLYGENGLGILLETLRLRWSKRPDFMRTLDIRRDADPLWYQRSTVVGMMLYVDNFAGTFAEMPSKLSYLEKLGITYIHLMPICKMPAVHNDGGYAVSDFTHIDKSFGTEEQFDAFTKECHQRNISLCFDFVLNHTSDEHAWAAGARTGDEACRQRYFIFPDRTLPDAYEKTVNEVFPVLAPGNFTYDGTMGEWVLTTFNSFQWDLNYGNPQVLADMIDAMLTMANRGIDIFRFDAIPYIWKQWGTNSRNLPQVHTIVRLFRLALEVSAPATIIKGEVVMAPREVAPYFGTPEAPECHLLYNVSFMVQLWNALATRDARMLAASIASIPVGVPKGSSWVNYARCHDDIGWGLDEAVLKNLGFDPFLHKRFLITFFLGTFPGSFSKGELYEADPRTLDARNTGTCASLCGLERAIEEQDEYQLELALKRIILLHTLCIVMDGIPVIYSGDEIAQLNDYTYINERRKSADSRFLHRGKFDWEAASQSKDLSLPGSKIFNQMLRIISVRKQEPLLGSGKSQRIIQTDDIGVLGILLEEKVPEIQSSRILVLANCTEYPKMVVITQTNPSGDIDRGLWTDLIQGKRIAPFFGQVLLGPYESLILKRNSYDRRDD